MHSSSRVGTLEGSHSHSRPVTTQGVAIQQATSKNKLPGQIVCSVSSAVYVCVCVHICQYSGHQCPLYIYSYLPLDEQAGASCIHWMQIRTQCYSSQRHLALHTVHSLMLDCHCAGRPFQSVPLLHQYWADSVQKSPSNHVFVIGQRLLNCCWC